MSDSKTMAVGSFGMDSPSRCRTKPEDSFLNLARRLLLAGAVLLGLVFSTPAYSATHVETLLSISISNGSACYVGGSVRCPLEWWLGPVSGDVTLYVYGEYRTVRILFDTGAEQLLEYHTSPPSPPPPAPVIPTVGLTPSSTSLTINEGSSKTFTVKLTKNPKNTRTVTLTSNNADVTVNKTSLTFTTSNWNQTQTVTVRAAHDADGVNDTATISLTGSKINTASVGVTVIDDDVGLSLSPSSLTIVEGRSKTFRVKLAKNPGGNRTVALASTNSDVTVDTKLAVAGKQNSLTFTSFNWNTYQAVRVYAAHDSDSVDDTARINLTGTGVVTGSVNVTVLDDDVRLTLSTSSLTIQEGGSRTFTVKLGNWPGNSRTINLTSANSDVTVDTNPSATGNQTALTFTASNWSTPRTVTVRAAHDSDKTNDSALIHLTGSGVVSASVPVNVIDDDDHAVGLTLSTSSLKMLEGSSKIFTVRLAERPGKGRTVNLSSTNSDVTVDTNPSATGNQTALTFTTSNWNTARTVRVRAAHDTDKLDETATINLTGTGVITSSVNVKVIDDDVRLTLSTSSLTIPEGGSRTFTVKLGNWPGNNRTINLSSSNSDVTVDTNASTVGNQTSLIFTASNWSTGRTVTVSAAHDTDKLDDAATISLTGTGIVSSSINVTVIDDDRVEFVLSPTSLKVSEGRTNTFTVKLTKNPGGTRTVNLTSNNAEVTVDAQSTVFGKQNSLTFTSSNWNQTRTVTVYAAQDDDKVDDTATINLTGTDITAGSVEVIVLDDDVGLSWSNFPSTIQEGGAKNFTVVGLDKWPGNNRTINLSSSNSDVTFDANPNETGNQTALILTASNWNTGQTVKIRAAHDSDKTNDSAGIYLTMSESGFSYWLQLTVIDDDVAVGLTLSQTSTLTMDEGSTASFTVKLAAQPGGNRTVNLASTNTDVTINPATLTFTGGGTGNWDTVQTVTLTAAHDDDTTDDSATINLTGTGITAGSVGVTVTDDDNTEGGFSLSQTSITTGQSWGHVIMAGLTKQPTANVIVTVITNNPDVNIYKGNVLTFTPSNWSVRQVIALNTLRDADIIDDIATISLTAAGGGYDSVTGAVLIKIIDDDVLEFSVDRFIHLAEGTQSSFTMKLAAQPSEDMTITFASSTSNSDVTFDTNANSAGNQNTLTFTTSNWSTAQTVKVRAADDADRTDESGRLKVWLPSGALKYIAVYVYDDDIEWNLSATSLTINEDGSGTFTVRPATESKWRRTVSLTSDNSDITFNNSKLTFYSTNWRTAKTVTVRAADDDDTVDDTATIGFEVRIPSNNNLVVTATDTVTVTVKDNDAGAAGFNISAIAPEAGDGGAGLFAVRLDDARPANGKLIDLGLGGDDVMSGIWSGDGAVSRLGEPGPGHQVAGAHRQYDRRRPEDQPHRLPRDRHVNFNLGFDHRRRHPTASA